MCVGRGRGGSHLGPTSRFCKINVKTCSPGSSMYSDVCVFFVWTFSHDFQHCLNSIIFLSGLFFSGGAGHDMISLYKLIIHWHQLANMILPQLRSCIDFSIPTWSFWWCWSYRWWSSYSPASSASSAHSWSLLMKKVRYDVILLCRKIRKKLKDE